MSLSEKRVLLVIAGSKFRDEEFDIPKKILEKEQAKITVASSTLAKITGIRGMKVEADILLENINVADFDAVVFVGGGGAREYYKSTLAHKIVRDTLSQGKILAAICISPVILANAGLLEGKKATVFYTEVAAIKDKGAIYIDEPVVKDGDIITADGPESAEEFAQTIVSALK